MTSLVDSDSTPDVAPRDVPLHRIRAATYVVALAAGAVALIRTGQPVPSDDTSLHRFFPVALCLTGVLMAVVAGRASSAIHGRDARSWLRLLAVTGLLEVVHSLSLGSLSLTLSVHRHSFPMSALAWAEDWVFVLADGVLVGLLVLAIPVTRRDRAWRFVVRAGAVLLALGVVCQMVTPRSLTNPADLPNPWGIPALAPLAHVGIACFLVVSLLGMVLAVIRTVAGSCSRERAARPPARIALAAALVVVASYVSQAATPQDASTTAAAAGCALSVVTWLAVTLLGVRAVALKDQQGVRR